jgi:hypothetical protein
MSAATDQMDSIMMQLNPEVADVIGNPAPPPSGSSAATSDGPSFAFDLPDRVPSKREQNATTKEAAKETVQRVSPTLKTMGYLARLLPGAERVRLYRKNQIGQLEYIGDYRLGDIESAGDLETLINRYAVPKYGPGEYHPIAVDGKGNERQVAPIYIATPPPNAPQENAMGLVRDLVMRLEQKQMNTPPPPDPIDQMLKMQRAMTQLKEMTGQKDGGAMDPMMLMMVMQQMQAQNAPRGPDPLLVALVEKMDSRMAGLEKKLAESSSMMPPLPPPPPDPFELIAKILPVLQPKEDPDRLTTRDIIALLQNQQQNQPKEDQPTWKDMLALVMDRRQEEKPQNTVLDQIEAVITAKRALESLSPPSQPAGSTFWDALGALFSQERFGAGIGAAIAGAVQKGGQQGAQRLPAGSVRSLPPEHVSVDQRLPAPVTTAVPPMPMSRPTPQKLEMPPAMQPLAEKLSAAQQDHERVDLVVQMLWALQPSEQWRPFVMEMLSLAAQNDKEQVLRGLQGLLGVLAGNNLVSRPQAKETLAAFDRNWVEIHKEISRQLGLAAAAQAQSEVAPASVPTTETVPEAPVALAASDLEDDEDGDEDDGPQVLDLPDDLYPEPLI